MMRRLFPGSRCARFLALQFCLLFPAGTGLCFEEVVETPSQIACCHVDAPGIVWYGSEGTLTFEELARYCGPILWFSPDEPLLEGRGVSGIRIPEPFPFEEPADTPVVYYRVRELLTDPEAPGGAYAISPDEKNLSVLHLDRIGGIRLDYFFYYSSEEGLGRHPHDVESAQFILQVIHNPQCPGCEYAISIQRVIAKAHGLDWYDNTLEVDGDVSFPLTLLVEEGKHATCTDKNGDGYYSPGYDVNKRINDAWGCRDVIRTGALFTAGYQAWMTKVRRPDAIVAPPLPQDSPLYEDFAQDDRDLPAKAAYVLRPFPRAEPARDDPKLFSLIDDKGYPDWPLEQSETNLKRIGHFFTAESFTKSVGVAYRYDGRHGVSIVFPLLFVKNVEEPLTGGWLVNRVYIRSKRGRDDIAWNLLYTPSASRWMDPYFSLGFEIENEEVGAQTDTTAHFAFETGVKLRGNLAHTPLKFMTFLTDFWGLRAGLKYLGFAAVDELSFVVEVGAGVW